MKRVTRIREQLTKTLNAITFAEAGEFETARSFVRAGSVQKAVLLIYDGQTIDSPAFSHALNLCKRLAARLEIVAFVPSRENGAASECSSDQEATDRRMSVLSRVAEGQSVPCSAYLLPTGSDEALLNHIRSHKAIAAVVDGSCNTGAVPPGRLPLRGLLESIAHRFSVPLIKVTGKLNLEDDSPFPTVLET